MTDQDNKSLLYVLVAILFTFMLALASQYLSNRHEKEMTDKGCIERMESAHLIWDCTKGK